MHYLMSLAPELVNAKVQDLDYAKNGEPVIPCFPAPVRNIFLSVTSFKVAPYAIVVEDPGLDPDLLVDQLAVQYPGLPRLIHENYVLRTAMAAAELPIGARVRPIITTDECHIQVVNEDTLVTLWEKQPTGRLI